MFRLPVRVRRVQQVLSSTTHLEYVKLKKVPKLTPFYKGKRLEWVDQHIDKVVEFWRAVLFSDEKRFKLGGPDGARHHWTDSRVPRWLFSTRQGGRGGVMVLWVAISTRGSTPMVFIDNTIDSAGHISVLQDTLVPFIENKFGEEGDYCLFQQDNASVHTSKLQKTGYLITISIVWVGLLNHRISTLSRMFGEC